MRVGWPIAAGVAIGLAFFAGITVEKSGHNPLPDGLPVVGGKPTEGLVEPSGCSLYDIAGYHKDEGCPVTVGKGFRVGYYTIRDGWTLKPGKAGPVLTAVVVNDNPGAISGLFYTFHLKRYDDSLVEIVWCETEAFAAGQARVMSCEPLSPDGNAPYDEVWIS
jgi:hypothetical protein